MRTPCVSLTKARGARRCLTSSIRIARRRSARKTTAPPRRCRRSARAGSCHRACCDRPNRPISRRLTGSKELAAPGRARVRVPELRLELGAREAEKRRWLVQRRVAGGTGRRALRAGRDGERKEDDGEAHRTSLASTAGIFGGWSRSASAARPLDSGETGARLAARGAFRATPRRA